MPQHNSCRFQGKALTTVLQCFTLTSGPGTGMQSILLPPQHLPVELSCSDANPLQTPDGPSKVVMCDLPRARPWLTPPWSLEIRSDPVPVVLSPGKLKACANSLGLQRVEVRGRCNTWVRDSGRRKIPAFLSTCWHKIPSWAINLSLQHRDQAVAPRAQPKSKLCPLSLEVSPVHLLGVRDEGFGEGRGLQQLSPPLRSFNSPG